LEVFYFLIIGYGVVSAAECLP